MKIILMWVFIASSIFAQTTEDNLDLTSVELKPEIIEVLNKEETINSIIFNKSIEWKKEYTLAIKYKSAKIYYIHFDNFKSLKDFLKTKNLRNDSDIEILKMVSKRFKNSENQSYSDLRIVDYKRK